MPTRSIRFGFHGFLNALPLLEPLQRKSRQGGFEMVVDTPSSIAEGLLAGRLDLAMVPSIEYLRAGDVLRLAPGLCIASRGAVGTVLLLTRIPLAEVRSLALDSRSRTSVALLKILFGDRFHPGVQFHPAAPDITGMLETHDAALIIGDPALNFAGQGMTVYDLSQEWYARTGKTFVHAVVAVRGDVPDAVMEAIRATRQEIPDGIARIAKNHAERSGVPLMACEDYLRNRIRYILGDEEMLGLTGFRDLCHARGLIPQKHDIRFI